MPTNLNDEPDLFARYQQGPNIVKQNREALVASDSTEDEPDLFAKYEEARKPAPDFFTIDSFRDMRNSSMQAGAGAIGSIGVVDSMYETKEDQQALNFIKEISELEEQGASKEALKALVAERAKQSGIARMGRGGAAAAFMNDTTDSSMSKLLTGFLEADEKGREGILELLKKPLYERSGFQWGEQFYQDTVANFPVKNPELFRNQVASGVGNVLSTVGAALITGGSGGFALGFSQNAKEEYLKAKEAGATEEEAIMAAQASGGVGAFTEMLPVGRLIDRIDVATGGSASGIMKTAIKNIIKGGTEEVATEELYKVLSNLIASDLVKYDPDRGIIEGVGEGMDVNFTVGGMINGIGYLLGVGGNKVFRPELTQERIKNQEALADANRLDKEQRTEAVRMVESGEVGAAGRAEAAQAEQQQQAKFEEVGRLSEELNTPLPAGAYVLDDSNAVTPREVQTEAMASQGLLSKDDNKAFRQAKEATDKGLINTINKSFEESNPVDSTRTPVENVEASSEQVKKLYNTAETNVNKLYDTVDSLGDVKVPKAIFEDFVEQIPEIIEQNTKKEFMGDGMDPILARTAKGILFKLTGEERTAQYESGEGTKDFTFNVDQNLTMMDIKAVRDLLGDVTTSKEGGSRKAAGALRAAFDDLLQTNRDQIQGDLGALDAYDTATKAYREFASTFKLREQDSIVSKWVKSDDIRKELSSILGVGQKSITAGLVPKLNELKALGDGPGTPYAHAQGAVVKRVENIVTAAYDTKKGEFNYSKFLDDYAKFKEDHSGKKGLINTHMPKEVMNTLDGIEKVSDILTKLENERSKDLTALDVGKLERIILEHNVFNIGQFMLSAKIAVGKVIATVIGRKAKLKSRGEDLQDAKVDPAAVALRNSSERIKKQMEAFEKEAKKRMESEKRINKNKEALNG